MIIKLTVKEAMQQEVWGAICCYRKYTQDTIDSMESTPNMLMTLIPSECMILGIYLSIADV